jgi:hypothetical protein
MRTRQDRRLGEEQLPVFGEDPDHSAPGILMEKAVNPLRNRPQERGELVDERERESGVRRGEAADLRPPPQGDLTIGEGRQVNARMDRGRAG